MVRSGPRHRTPRKRTPHLHTPPTQKKITSKKQTPKKFEKKKNNTNKTNTPPPTPPKTEKTTATPKKKPKKKNPTVKDLWEQKKVRRISKGVRRRRSGHPCWGGKGTYPVNDKHLTKVKGRAGRRRTGEGRREKPERSRRPLRQRRGGQ